MGEDDEWRGSTGARLDAVEKTLERLDIGSVGNKLDNLQQRQDKIETRIWVMIVGAAAWVSTNFMEIARVVAALTSGGGK